MEIKPIETVYKGYRFRSRLEARWAVFFDAVGMAWEYETAGFDMDGMRYLPDFHIPSMSGGIDYDPGYSRYGGFIEIKPKIENRPYCKIYLAGKMDGSWRYDLECELSKRSERFSIVGPYGLDHNVTQSIDIVHHCLLQIKEADCVFVNLNTTDTPGTLVEIGFSFVHRKGLLIRYENEEIKEYMWFVGGLSDLHKQAGMNAKEIVGGSVSDLLVNNLPVLSSGFNKCKKLSHYKRTILFEGDPMDFNMIVFTRGNDADWSGSTSKGLSAFLGINIESIESAAKKARGARFEFGESGNG